MTLAGGPVASGKGVDRAEEAVDWAKEAIDWAEEAERLTYFVLSGNSV